MKYEDYLSGKHWQNLRYARQIFDGCAYQVCGAQEHLEVHHKRYSKNWEDTNINDLITLCHNCHATVTAFIEIINKHKERFIANFGEAADTYLVDLMLLNIKKRHIAPEWHTAKLWNEYDRLLWLSFYQTGVIPLGNRIDRVHLAQALRGRY